MRDSIYREPRSFLAPFKFDKKVALSFNDMINRSIPIYSDIVEHQIHIIEKFYDPETYIYDLGCSNGNICIRICRNKFLQKARVIAVDSSEHMLEVLKQRLKVENKSSIVSVVRCKIEDLGMGNASIVVLNFTLQFLRKKYRKKVLKKIYNALIPGGILLLSEKIMDEDPILSDVQAEFYYRFKRNQGYSDLEIVQKNEALEGFLIPETPEKHENRLAQIGFEKVMMCLRWFNFCFWMCKK